VGVTRLHFNRTPKAGDRHSATSLIGSALPFRHRVFELRGSQGANDASSSFRNREDIPDARVGTPIKDLLLKGLGYPKSIRLTLLRKIVQRLSLFSYRDRLALCAVERPHYGHCIFEAAQLAVQLNYPKMSVIEFGCGGGNGLLNAEMHISEVSKLFQLEIELYGFDTGEGLPAPKDYRDFPFYFRSGLYGMNRDTLKAKLTRGKLVLGDVKDTCRTFFDEYKPAPIGCVFHDLDFYSSTNEALGLFDADPVHFLPRIFMYFDDVIGGNTWLVSEFAGELLAIEEFNRKHSFKRIVANRYMPIVYPDQWWSHEMYVYHDFRHPKYNVFVGENQQLKHEMDIKLR
jgi:hypothetical protein